MDPQRVEYISIPDMPKGYELIPSDIAKSLFIALEKIFKPQGVKASGKRLRRGLIEFMARRFVRQLELNKSFGAQDLKTFLLSQGVDASDSRIYATIRRLIKDESIQVLQEGSRPKTGQKAVRGIYRANPDVRR